MPTKISKVIRNRKIQPTHWFSAYQRRPTPIYFIPFVSKETTFYSKNTRTKQHLWWTETLSSIDKEFVRNLIKVGRTSKDCFNLRNSLPSWWWANVGTEGIRNAPQTALQMVSLLIYYKVASVLLGTSSGAWGATSNKPVVSEALTREWTSSVWTLGTCGKIMVKVLSTYVLVGRWSLEHFKNGKLLGEISLLQSYL